MQDRLHPVLQTRPLPDDVSPAGGLSPQRLRLVVRDPDRGQKAGRQQLRKHLRVDLGGLELRLGDRARLGRVRDDHPTDLLLEETRDRVRVAGRFKRDLILIAKAAGKLPQRLRRRLDPARQADNTVLVDRDLGELATHIETGNSVAYSLLPTIHGCGAQTADQPRIRAHSASGRAGAATSPTRARSPPSENGLPELRLLPGAPVPDARTVLTSPDTNKHRGRSRVTRSIRRISYADTNQIEFAARTEMAPHRRCGSRRAAEGRARLSSRGG